MGTPFPADAPVFLIGFMASGKTTVGRLVAQTLGWKFVDLDQAITATARRSVTRIFAEEGEGGFRRRESEALGQFSTARGIVIATGGGAACMESNLALMLATGPVVTLAVTPAAALRRAGSDSGRPLLAGASGQAASTAPQPSPPDPVAAAAALLAMREPFYARAHHRVETEGKSPPQVAAEVVRLVEAPPR